MWYVFSTAALPLYYHYGFSRSRKCRVRITASTKSQRKYVSPSYPNAYCEYQRHQETFWMWESQARVLLPCPPGRSPAGQQGGFLGQYSGFLESGDWKRSQEAIYGLIARMKKEGMWFKYLELIRYVYYIAYIGMDSARTVSSRHYRKQNCIFTYYKRIKSWSWIRVLLDEV